MAAEKAGWRLSVVKASAQVRFGPDDGAADPDAAFLDDGLSIVDERLAATDLQKRVLIGFERHWAHVPGPLAHGLETEMPLADCEFEGGGWYWDDLVSW